MESPAPPGSSTGWREQPQPRSALICSFQRPKAAWNSLPADSETLWSSPQHLLWHGLQAAPPRVPQVHAQTQCGWAGAWGRGTTGPARPQGAPASANNQPLPALKENFISKHMNSLPKSELNYTASLFAVYRHFPPQLSMCIDLAGLCFEREG